MLSLPVFQALTITTWCQKWDREQKFSFFRGILSRTSVRCCPRKSKPHCQKWLDVTCSIHRILRSCQKEILRRTGNALRWLNTVSSTYIWMGLYSLSLDATIMLSKNCSVIGEFSAPKAVFKGVFKRSYCCYGNLKCQNNDDNVFTND